MNGYQFVGLCIPLSHPSMLPCPHEPPTPLALPSLCTGTPPPAPPALVPPHLLLYSPLSFAPSPLTLTGSVLLLPAPSPFSLTSALLLLSFCLPISTYYLPSSPPLEHGPLAPLFLPLLSPGDGQAVQTESIQVLLYSLHTPHTPQNRTHATSVSL